MGEAIGSIGQVVTDGIEKAEKTFAKERREAEAVIGADADLELDARLESLKAEHFKLKGLAASEGRAEAARKAAKARQDVAAGIASEAERNRFLQRSATAVMAARRQVEAYSGREYDAHRESVVKATEDSAVAKAASGVLDPAEFGLVEQQASETIRATQRSDEEGAARLAELQSRMSEAYVDGLIAQGRPEEAVAYAEREKARLGARYPSVAARAEKAQKGRQLDQRSVEMRKYVDDRIATIKAAPDGYLTEEQIRNAVPNEGYDADSARVVEDRIRERSAEEARRKAADTQKYRDNANRADIERQPIDGRTLNWLKEHDPDFLLARESRKQAQHDRWLARQQGTAAERSAAEKRQQADDEAFRNRVRAEIAANPNVDLRDVETRFIVEKTKQYGRPVAISDPEREHANAVIAEERKKDGTRAAADAEADRARIEKVIVAAAKKRLGKGEKLDPAAIKDEVGRDLLIYDQRVRQNGGKPLSEAEWVNFEQFIADDIVQTKPGRLYGSNEVNVGRPGQQKTEGPEAPPPGFIKPKQSAPQKEVKSWAYSPDRKQRRPIYADGSLGPIEEVK